MSLLFEMREKLRDMEDFYGLGDLTESERGIFAFISNQETYRDEIINNEYFQDISLSTMKRAVARLIDLELVIAVPCKIDKRKKLLYVT